MKKSGIRKLIENQAKLNLIQCLELVGSKYAIIKSGNLYLSPSMMRLVKSSTPAETRKILENLNVYDAKDEASILLVARELVILTTDERNYTPKKIVSKSN